MLPSRIFFDDMLDEFKFDEKMKCDIYEKDGKYNVETAVPGFDKDDIKIEVDKGTLTITAEKKEEEKDSSKKYIRRERMFHGKYQRSFYLGDIDEENIKATFNNGILKITVPQKELPDTKKTIEIK